ncbi:hypothetical protein JYB87_03360 [Shewanella avicenniae]|uniref:Uncharacterized protein n=1 Tax=Shewanella avicenniae TaxID=2814294 RepID=A0ABX7QTY6_9GAMM|nr:hypothetical protein [Shewanella avicenniae]QSX34303.1 hypothetical protein JYB87_03360 [Shewanella avicenniae]
MKNFTSTLIAGVLVSTSLLGNAAEAADTAADVQHQLVTSISNSISQQANELYYGAKAEILASIQRELSLSLASLELDNSQAPMMAEANDAPVANDANALQTAAK